MAREPSKPLGSVVPPVEDWLKKQAEEEIIDPALPIVDPHHHDAHSIKCDRRYRTPPHVDHLHQGLTVAVSGEEIVYHKGHHNRKGNSWSRAV